MIKNGINYTLDISETVDHFIYFGFADKSFDRIISYVRHDSIIIDVGANIGRFTLIFASLAKVGKIIGYEPDPTTFSFLKSNIENNCYNNVRIINKALGENQGNLNLFKVDPHNSGMNRILKERHSDIDSVVIPVSTLDREAEELKLERLDIIKIDVEGFEFKVLQGGKKTIGKFRPVLFIELVDENLHDSGSSPLEIVTWIEEQNYKLFVAASMIPITSLDSLTDCHFDVICFPS